MSRYTKAFTCMSTLLFMLSFDAVAHANPVVTPLDYINDIRYIYPFLMIVLIECGIFTLATNIPVKTSFLAVVAANVLSSFAGIPLRIGINYIFEPSHNLINFLIVFLVYCPISTACELPIYYGFMWSESKINPLKLALMASVYSNLASYIVLVLFMRPEKLAFGVAL